MSTSSDRKPYRGLAEAKVRDVLRAYKAENVPWDSLVEPVQDALIQEFMRYYPKWGKTVCRACGCQSRKHVGRDRGCLGVPNVAVLDIARIIDLCCDEAHKSRQVATVVRKAIADGSSPLVDPSVRIGYSRPHYDVTSIKRASSSVKSSPPSSPQQPGQSPAVDEHHSANGTSDAPKAGGDQAHVLVREMGLQVGAALAEANQRTESTNQAIMAALNLLGSEVRNLRAENDAIRAQAAQALQVSSRLCETVPATRDAAPIPFRPNQTATSTVGSDQSHTVVYIDDVDSTNAHKAADATTASDKPLARSSKNVFQLPTQDRQSMQAARAAAIAAAVTAAPKTVQGAPPSPLYPVISRPSMQPRLVSLAH